MLRLLLPSLPLLLITDRMEEDGTEDNYSYDDDDVSSPPQQQQYCAPVPHAPRPTFVAAVPFASEFVVVQDDYHQYQYGSLVLLLLLIWNVCCRYYCLHLKRTETDDDDDDTHHQEASRMNLLEVIILPSVLIMLTLIGV